MKLIDVGEQAQGVIAIGNEAVGIVAIGGIATGVIAIGWMAQGVVAVGQAARGFFVLGQAAVGVVTVGQLAVGLYACIAQLGLAGRKGVGGVWALFGKPEDEAALPEPSPLDKLLYGEIAEGWLRVRLSDRGGKVDVTHEGRSVDIEIPFHKKALKIARARWSEVMLKVQAEDRAAENSTYAEWHLVAREMKPIPEPGYRRGGWLAGTLVKAIVMSILVAFYWAVVVTPIWRAFGLAALPFDFGVP